MLADHDACSLARSSPRRTSSRSHAHRRPQAQHPRPQVTSSTTAQRNALAAACLKLTASRTLCYSVLLLLEADYSNDDGVVRANWSASNGLGPGFEDEFLKDRFVVNLVLRAPKRTHLLESGFNSTGSSWIVVLIVSTLRTGVCSLPPAHHDYHGPSPHAQL